jgi:hypothetical protein
MDLILRRAFDKNIDPEFWYESKKYRKQALALARANVRLYSELDHEARAENNLEKLFTLCGFPSHLC